MCENPKLFKITYYEGISRIPKDSNHLNKKYPLTAEGKKNILSQVAPLFPDQNKNGRPPNFTTWIAESQVKRLKIFFFIPQKMKYLFIQIVKTLWGFWKYRQNGGKCF